MPKVLITGANGFVGSALCEELNKRMIPLVACVRNKSQPNQFEIGNLSAETDWSNSLVGCDAVIHLAARVHVMRDHAQDPALAYRALNVDATMRLARQAAVQGVRRFVFVSSVKVNGETTSSTPFTADDMPAPVDPYGQSKLDAERALFALSTETGMELVVVRPPLVYGHGVRANFFKLMQWVKFGVPLPFKKACNRRSMIALDNLVDFLALCIDHPHAAGQVFMVSDDQDLSLMELVSLIAGSMNKRLMLVPLSTDWMVRGARLLGKADVAQRLFGALQVDIAATRQRLDWKPVIDVDAAVRKTVGHFLARG